VVVVLLGGLTKFSAEGFGGREPLARKKHRRSVTVITSFEIIFSSYYIYNVALSTSILDILYIHDI